MTTTTRIAAIAAVVGSVFAAATSASAALNLPTQNCAYTFTTNMKRGTRSQQVMDLQKVLNMYPQTTIATTGAGSMGNETMFYGAATAKAVAKFQELHAADILTPIGATKGTGNVFSLTRAVLNQICTGATTGTTTPTTSGAVSVSLAANQPSTVLVATQVSARIADFTFTGNGLVTNVTLMRTGVSANDTLANVYLYDGAVRLTDASSANTQGVITFNSLSGLFNVAGSKTITVRSDIAAATNGQSVGVNLTGFKLSGATAATTNVTGVQLPVAAVNLAGLTLNTQTAIVNANLNLPQLNYNVWGSSVNVATRAVNLKNFTVKMIGSAPVNSVTNVTLYVDGVSAGTAMADANQRFVFSPMRNLTTGSHTLEVRADVVSGANRNFYFSLENVADLIAEDSNVLGANVPVLGYSANKNGGLQTIGSASATSITVNTDPTFTTSNLVTAGTNQTIAKYRLIAYGEDTKVEFISIATTQPTPSNLTNVALFVNGAQVGSNYTVASGATQQFSLGSNFIALAGQTNTVEIRADLVTASGVNATGTVAATINAVSGIGRSSQNSFSQTPSPTVRTLTIGGGTPQFGKTIGAVSANVAANSTVKIGSFSIQGGSTESVNLRSFVLAIGGTIALTNLSNVTLTDEAGVTIAQPTGIAAASQTYNVNIPVASGVTKRIDVTATVGSAVNGNTIIPSLTTTFIGSTSNQSSTTVAVLGDTVTIATIVVGTPTISSKIAQQYVLGGTSKQTVIFNATSSNGVATLNDASFTITGSGVQSLTVNGNTANVIGSTATFTGLNLAIPAGNSGVNVPVTVNFTPAFISTGNGVPSGSTNSIAMTGAKITDASGNVTTPTYTGLNSNTITLVTTLPTLNAVANSGTNVGVGVSGTVKLGSITVKADVAGDVVIGTLAYTASGPGTVTVNGIKVDGAAAQDKLGATPTAGATATTFAAGYRITAGTTKTFDLFGTVNNGGTVNGNTSVSLGANAGFSWSDDAGSNGTGLTGTLLTATNYNN